NTISTHKGEAGPLPCRIPPCMFSSTRSRAPRFRGRNGIVSPGYRTGIEGITSVSAIGPIHHIGIIVSDLEAAADKYRAMGFIPGEIERVESQNIAAIAMRAGDSWIELVTPLDHDSPLG